MTSDEIYMVRQSFKKIAPIAEQAAVLFYARLFELDSSLRPLFRGNMTAQGRKLMAMIATAVAGLDRPDVLLPALRQLGVRHVHYGVTDEHYATVGAALMWTLEKGLGADFNPEVREAWLKTYTLVANTMVDAANQAAAA